MSTIKEILHEKRKTTEEHIKELRQEGKQGVRYTAMMSDIPFPLFGLISDDKIRFIRKLNDGWLH